jgi:site-specific DNA-methyltransferase (cytosine-N4-specific)
VNDWLNRCHFGDCLDVLRRMPDGIANTCVTSPPYFGLRDYGHPGQIGLEQTPDEFVAKLVEVFREVRRVLRDDGTIWVNMGDSYANDGKWGGSSGGKHAKDLHGNTGVGRGKKQTGLKPKDLIGVPWMLAFALRADGWYLRQDVIWAKPNPMPESVTDRCTKSHEYIFLLSKAPSYYCDMQAIKEPAVASDIGAMDGGAQKSPDGSNANSGRNFRLAGNVNPPKGQAAYEAGDERHRTKAGLLDYAERQRSKRDSFMREGSKRAEIIPGQSAGTHRPDRAESEYDLFTRNKRSVWTVSTKPYKGAHFATFPPDLIEPCILAGAPAGGVVLDPFFGSGTTGQVAQALGRKFIGIELNADYKALQDERLRQPSLDLEATCE